MQGFERPDDLVSVAALAPGLVDGKSIFGLLAGSRDKIFPPQLVDGMFKPRSSAGQPSVPGPVMCSVLLLQALHGLSDRETVEALTFDLRWKSACGLGVDQVGFHHSTLAYWRARIARSDNPNLIFDAVGRVIAECGVIRVKGRRVVDSTVVDDCVARQDTFKLLIWQIGRIKKLIPGLGSQICGLPGGCWYEDRVKPDIDWRNQDARDDLVSILVEDAKTVTGWATQIVDGLKDDDPVKVTLADQVGLLGVLAGQDVEPAPGSDGTDGRWRIAKRTAPDRVISTVDPQARHIRKTTQNKHDGFKTHVVAEPDTGLVVATTISSGCGDGSSDATNAIIMLNGDPDIASGRVSEILGDAAYGSAAMLEATDSWGVEAIIKPRPLPVPTQGGYDLDDFVVDANGAVVCPAGHSATRDLKGRASFSTWCGQCFLRGKCTTSKMGRTVTLGDTQLRVRQHRQDAAKPWFVARIQQHRPMVERTIGWLTRPGRRTPYRGIMKTGIWWAMRAAGINLKRLTVLGLQYNNGAWLLAPPG